METHISNLILFLTPWNFTSCLHRKCFIHHKFRYLLIGFASERWFYNLLNLWQIFNKHCDVKIYCLLFSFSIVSYPTNKSIPILIIIHSIIITDVPLSKPIITELKKWYSLGDILKGNCTAQYSKPAANLTWFINNKPVSIYIIIKATVYLYLYPNSLIFYAFKTFYFNKLNYSVYVFKTQLVLISDGFS